MNTEAARCDDRLQEQLARLQAETRELRAKYFAAERHQASLLSSYVALLRLHASLGRDELLLALQEVLASLVGCEQAAVYLREGELLRPVAVFGVPAEQAPVIVWGQGRVGRAAATGAPDVAEDAGAGDGISACVPLLLAGAPVGALVLFGLLSQKPALEPADLELLELLGTHFPIALRATSTPAGSLSA
ncbi:MAG: GAF domain-containing protein [Vicinamibacteria bacterium]|nr:GAF domain-containing protein [Vicinamibacteria bacterium]